MDPNGLSSGRVRESRLAHWHTRSGEDVAITRIEFCISLDDQKAYESQWTAKSLVAVLHDYIPR